MVIGFIMTMFNPDNVLWGKDGKSKVTVEWIKKHCKHSSDLTFRTLSLTMRFSMYAANKGITALLLCRFGLATIETGCGFRSAQWRTDICPISDQAIREKHAEAIRLLRTNKKYGGYDVVRFLVGPQAAEMLAKKNYVMACRLPTDVASASTSARRRRDDEDEDEHRRFVSCGSISKCSKVRRMK